VPFLPNLKEQTPLHIANDKEDYKTIDTCLFYLKGYGLDHHSRGIVDLIPLFIEK
jgi:hypothetical protein